VVLPIMLGCNPAPSYPRSILRSSGVNCTHPSLRPNLIASPAVNSSRLVLWAHLVDQGTEESDGFVGNSSAYAGGVNTILEVGDDRVARHSRASLARARGEEYRRRHRETISGREHGVPLTARRLSRTLRSGAREAVRRRSLAAAGNCRCRQHHRQDRWRCSVPSRAHAHKIREAAGILTHRSDRLDQSGGYFRRLLTDDPRCRRELRERPRGRDRAR